MEILVNLYKLELDKKSTTETEKETKPPEGGESLSNGTKDITTASGKDVTPEQAAELRQKNPREYNKLVRKGKLNISDS